MVGAVWAWSIYVTPPLTPPTPPTRKKKTLIKIKYCLVQRREQINMSKKKRASLFVVVRSRAPHRFWFLKFQEDKNLSGEPLSPTAAEREAPANA